MQTKVALRGSLKVKKEKKNEILPLKKDESL